MVALLSGAALQYSVGGGAAPPRMSEVHGARGVLSPCPVRGAKEGREMRYRCTVQLLRGIFPPWKYNARSRSLGGCVPRSRNGLAGRLAGRLAEIFVFNTTRNLETMSLWSGSERLNSSV